MKKFIWLLLGLVLGAVMGVGYAWVIHPAEFRGAAPASLRPDYRGEYILLIASAYEADGNLERARTRLALFPELNGESLASLAQQVVAAQGPNDAARGLARLSVTLRGQTPSFTAPGENATPGSSPTVRLPLTLEPTLALTIPYLPTSTLRPTIPSSPTPIPKFVLKTKEQVCNAQFGRVLIQVLVQSADGKGVPGVEIRIQWEGGQGRFVTGMKPELSPGYADYTVEPKKSYQITLGDGLTVVRDLAAPACPSGATSFVGSWRLVFEMR